MATATPPVVRRSHTLSLRGGEAVLGPRTWLMGILNVTPDSFSDGGRFADLDAAVRAGLGLFEDGADVVDVGGESTRPGASALTAAEEIRRVAPVIEALRARGAGYLSVDTTKAEVARAALEAGADIVNDVSGLLFDPALAAVAARHGAPLVLMHVRGRFSTMHESPSYGDVMGEVRAELEAAVLRATAGGVPRGALLVDPGIGFSKSAAHSLEALRRLPELLALELPVLVGPSRKSFIGTVLDLPVRERLMGTAAAVAAAVFGGAHVVRVHDVAPLREVVRMCDAILAAGAA